VVVTDADHRVVGIGVIGYQPRRAGEMPPDSFTAIAPAGDGPYTVIAIEGR
jgi:hypothetical protein